MRKFYSILIFILFIIRKLFFYDFGISGLLCNFFAVSFILLNVACLIKFRKDMKFKGISTVLSFLSIILIRNKYELFFVFSGFITMIVICILDEKVYLKFICILLISNSIFCPFFIILPVVSVFFNASDIYEDTHYYCKGDYEIYVYSYGAMDKFHFEKVKYYYLIDFDDIISLYFKVSGEITRTEYDEFFRNNVCYKMEDKNGFE